MKVIKGSFPSLDKGLILTFGSFMTLLILFYKVIFTDIPIDSEKYYELVLFTIGQFCLSVFLYWLLSTDYYYYELHTDKIIVRNLLRPYLRELPLSNLQYVDLWGDLSTSKWSSNGLEFIYQYNDSRKNFHYSSINYGRNDWILLIEEMKNLNIDLRDPYKRFFKYTNIRLE